MIDQTENQLPRMPTEELTAEACLEAFDTYCTNVRREVGSDKIRASVQLVVVEKPNGASDLMMQQIIGTSEDLATLLMSVVQDLVRQDDGFRQALMMQQLAALENMIESVNVPRH